MLPSQHCVGITGGSVKLVGAGAGGTSIGTPPFTSKAAPIGNGVPFCSHTIPRLISGGIHPRVVISPCHPPLANLFTTNLI